MKPIYLLGVTAFVASLVLAAAIGLKRPELGFTAFVVAVVGIGIAARYSQHVDDLEAKAAKQSSKRAIGRYPRPGAR